MISPDPIPTILIGLCGPKGSGKTTLANHLAAHMGFRRLSFADPIREMLYVLGLTLEELTERKEIPLERFAGATPRQLMQSLGTEWGRAYAGPNVWVDAALTRARRYPWAVFDDVRFDNEAKAVRAAGGRIIQCGNWSASPEHASEQQLDLTLVNYVLEDAFAAREDAVLRIANQMGEREEVSHG